MKANAILRHGRLILFFTILVGLLWCCLILLIYAHNGTLDLEGGDGAKSAIEQLSAGYFPQLGIIGAYYFSERRTKETRRHASREAFVFSLAVTIIATISPPIVLMSIKITADALGWIRQFAPFSQTIAAGAISYYFARGMRDDAPASGGTPPSSGEDSSRSKRT
jgi:hypothetical protein